MKHHACFFAFAALCTAACGPQASPETAASNGTQPIINGTACGKEAFPSAVAILIDGEIDLMGFGVLPLKTVVCTGTVVAPDVVMAAAHCVDEKTLTSGFGTLTRADFYITSEPDLGALASGMMDVEFPADSVLVREAVKHPQFNVDDLGQVNGPGDFKDISLLFLDRPITVPPMHIISEDEETALVQGAEVDIAGWGQQAQGSGNPLEPPPAGSVGIKICARTTINELGSMEMQVGSDAMSGRKCHGDSGGPTYLTLPQGGMRVVGVTSHAYDSTDCNSKGGVDTRVDVWRDWLDGEVRSRCADQTRVWCDSAGVPPSDYTFPVLTVDEDGGVTFVDAGPTEEPDAGAEVDAGQGTQGSAGDSPQPGPTCSHAGVTTTQPAWLAGVLGMLLVMRVRKRG
mgnify:CR=1 FL=1